MLTLMNSLVKQKLMKFDTKGKYKSTTCSGLNQPLSHINLTSKFSHSTCANFTKLSTRRFLTPFNGFIDLSSSKKVSLVV